MTTVQALIDRLQLQPHPEGGYYRETYRSDTGIPLSGSEQHPYGRAFSTAIYFLLGGTDFSAFHRIRSDEVWHFYEGGPLHVYVIDKEGVLEMIRLGRDIAAGEVFQAVVKAGHWFASAPVHTDQYTLVGCTVAPGFDFRDFEMAERQSLRAQYPQHTTLIERLTRQ